jgi:hypothetical protein
MKTLILSGLTWHVHSPALLELKHPEGNVLVGFDGRNWRVGVNGTYGTGVWPSRDQAALSVARIFQDAMRRA